MASTRVKIKIKKGDNVQVIAGKDAGKRGKVLRVLRRTTAWWSRS